MDLNEYPLHLTSTELDHELVIRGIGKLANNRIKTATLRDLLRMEEAGSREKPLWNGDFDECAEIVTCRHIVDDITAKAEEAADSHSLAELARCKSRLMHVQGRLERLRPIDVELVRNVYVLRDDVVFALTRVCEHLTAPTKKTVREKNVVEGEVGLMPRGLSSSSVKGGQTRVDDHALGRAFSLLELGDDREEEGAVGGHLCEGGGEALSDVEFISSNERRDFRKFARNQGSMYPNTNIGKNIRRTATHANNGQEEQMFNVEHPMGAPHKEQVQNQFRVPDDRAQHAGVHTQQYPAEVRNSSTQSIAHNYPRNNAVRVGAASDRAVCTNDLGRRVFSEDMGVRNVLRSREEVERVHNDGIHNIQNNNFGHSGTEFGRPRQIGNMFRRHTQFDVRNNVRKSVPINQWKIQFSGDGVGLHLYDFLSQVALFQRSESVADEEMVFSVIHLLSGRARLWFLSVCDTFVDWADVVHALKREFLPANYDYLLFNDITNRQQRDNESFGSYITHMQALFKCLSVQLDESHKLFIVQKNLLPRYALAIAPLELRNLAELSDACRRIDNACATTNRNTYSMPFSQSGEGIFAMQQNHVAPQQQRSYDESRNGGKCWNCQLTGHSHRECTQQRTGVFCYKCGARGVITNRCPKCSGNGRANPEVNAPRDSTVN